MLGTLALVAAQQDSPSYDESIARIATQYSSAAYCPPTEVARWDMNTGMCSSIASFEIIDTYEVPDDGPFSNNRGFGYVGVDHANAWVLGVFKGSNDTADWIQDFTGGEFDFKTCTLPSGTTTAGNVHDGFCEYYSDLGELKMATDFVAAVQSTGYTPVVTGHSLGAAAAVLMAYDVYEASSGEISPTVYTFGLPRVGDHTFSEGLSSRVTAAYRLTHDRDVVPHLPKCCPGLGKCGTGSACPYHTATEIFYKEDMSEGSSFTVCDGSGEDPSCSNGQVDLSSSDHCEYFDGICGTCCM